MDWSTYNRERVDNIKAQVDMADILEHYGINIRTRDREFQFPCPLHGDGQDDGYSARLYPDDNAGGSTYCFACHKDRDAIQWVRDMEGLSFGKALSFIERTFGVTDIPKPTFDRTSKSQRREADAGLEVHQTGPSLLDHIHRMDVKLRRLLREKELPRESVMRLFFVLDSLRYDLTNEEKEPGELVKVMKKVYSKIKSWA